eukprot:9206045-Pyramimonas_sp.AAC.1
MLWVSSHLSPHELLIRGIPLALVLGNQVDDDLTSLCAEKIRLPQAQRFRVCDIEGKACLVRKRLMRANIDVMNVVQEV